MRTLPLMYVRLAHQPPVDSQGKQNITDVHMILFSFLIPPFYLLLLCSQPLCAQQWHTTRPWSCSSTWIGLLNISGHLAYFHVFHPSILTSFLLHCSSSCCSWHLLNSLQATLSGEHAIKLDFLPECTAYFTLSQADVRLLGGVLYRFWTRQKGCVWGVTHHNIVNCRMLV